jgi:hypothetical protein
MKQSKKKATIDLFVQSVLENSKNPETVYQFCKENGLNEADFYKEYASLQVIEKKVFSNFYSHTLELLTKNDAYQQYGPQEKLLSFYFTFFEVLTANRSYVLIALKQERASLKNLQKLGELRIHFKQYAKEIFSGHIASNIKNIEKVKSETFQEGAWVQLLVLLKFWIEDESTGFEKTDIFIEKAVAATFDLIDNTPVQSIIDLGKFIYKEITSK